MKKEIVIDEILQELENNGSSLSTLKDVKKKILTLSSKNPLDVIDEVLKELQSQSYDFLEKKNGVGINYIYGLSTCIFLPSENGSYKFKIINGHTSSQKDTKVDEHTLFDVASITKMFTLLLTFKLVEHGYFNLSDKIADLDDRFKGLEDFTIDDILKLCGTLYTQGRLDEADNYQQAMDRLKSVILKSNDRTVNNYTDIGAIILGKVIEKVINQQNKTNLTYDEILEKYILRPFDLLNTTYNPSPRYQIAGNDNQMNLVHDPKARILNGVAGSAGLFTNSEDLAKVAMEMFKVNTVDYDHLRHLVSKPNLIRMGTKTFEDTPQSDKGLLGLYQKHTSNDKFFAPKDYSNNVFAHQGWTGSSTIFDPINQIHNSILVGAIRTDLDKELVKNDKPIGFIDAFHEYQDVITRYTLVLLTLKKYYEKNYLNIDIEKTL